jgi:hypothetical protein
MLKMLAVLVSLMLVHGAPARAQLNVSLGRPYTLTPEPNYPYCTDPGDATQLTDGAATPGYFWTTMSTVGWQYTPTVRVIVDLGRDTPICGASVRTAAGRSGAQWPQYIWVLASSDGSTWNEVGDLVAASNSRLGPPPATGYAVHRYATDAWRAHGRWIAFVAVAGGDYLFADEVEVLGAPIVPTPPARSFVSFEQFQLHARTVARLDSDWQSLKAAVQRAPLSVLARAGFLKDLQKLAADPSREPQPADPATFRAVLPLTGWHAGLFALQSRLWAAVGIPKVVANVPAAPCDPVPYITERPIGLLAKAPSAAVLAAWGETRAVAVNLTNARESTVYARARISGLPGGPNPTWVRARAAVWTDTQEGNPISSALPDAPLVDGTYRFAIPAGMVGQLWLSVTPPPELAAATYSGQITVTTDTLYSATIPLKVTVAPVTLAGRSSLCLGGWDYSDDDGEYGINPQNIGGFIALLKEHGVNAPWAEVRVVPPGSYDANGNMTLLPSTYYFDQWLSRWPAAKRYQVFVNAGTTFAGFAIGTDAFRTALTRWSAFWARYAARRGLAPGQLRFLLVDEPSNADRDQRIAAWAPIVRAAAPNIAIWEDPDWNDPYAMDPAVAEVSHTLCPSRTKWLAGGPAFSSYYLARKATGTQLALYDALSAGLADPYACHRLQAWHAFQIGADETHYWSFADSGGEGSSSWNPYVAPRAAFSALYVGPTEVVTAKPMEAIREGAQDFELLTMLKAATDGRSKVYGADDALVREAAVGLTSSVQQVLAPMTVNALQWTAYKDRTLADVWHDRILRLLVRLNGG